MPDTLGPCHIWEMMPESDEFPGLEPACALVVLGCRLRKRRPGSALLRRLRRAELICRANPALPIIMSGGQKWQGCSEAVAMANWWAQRGLPLESLHKEEKSFNTRQNAAKVAILCEQLRYHHLVLVTCDFHMPRAERLFSEQGLRVTRAEAVHERTWPSRLRLQGREWGARLIEAWETRCP